VHGSASALRGHQNRQRSGSEVPNPENINEEVVLHVGDRISEKAAEKLVELYEVTTIPA